MSAVWQPVNCEHSLPIPQSCEETEREGEGDDIMAEEGSVEDWLLACLSGDYSHTVADMSEVHAQLGRWHGNCKRCDVLLDTAG